MNAYENSMDDAIGITFLLNKYIFYRENELTV